MANDKTYLTIKEAIQYTGLCDSTIRKYMKEGLIKYKQWGPNKKILILKASLDCNN